MNELYLVILVAILTATLTYVVEFVLNLKIKKLVFVILSIINLGVTITLIIRKSIEDKHIQEQNEIYKQSSIRKADSLQQGISIIKIKQDSVKSLLEKFGIRPDYNNTDVLLNVNNNFSQFLTQSIRVQNQQNVRLSEFNTYNLQPPPQVDSDSSSQQEITTTEMDESSCIDKGYNLQYAKVYFNNKTGQQLTLYRYEGYYNSSSSERQSLPKDKVTPTGRLAINTIEGAAEKDFSFFFLKEDGSDCKTPYRTTLRKCLNYTITLHASDLGL